MTFVIYLINQFFSQRDYKLTLGEMQEDYPMSRMKNTFFMTRLYNPNSLINIDDKVAY